MKANTVKNDMVEASSEAELRTSERGMGLGIDVVGGGEAEVTLKTRAGWHFANGASEQTVYKSRGATVLSLPLVGDNSGAESGGRVPVGGTEDPPDEPPPAEDPGDEDPHNPEDPPKDEDPPSEDLPKAHDAPKLALSFDTKNGPATAVARSVLDTEGYMTFTVTLNAEVVEKGIHDKDGDALEFSPTKYHWSWGEKGEKDDANSCETDDASVTVTVRLSKKSDVIDRKVTFSVYGSGCEHCREEVPTEKCSIEHTVRVYVLSIERKDYLGVNRTDEYWATGNDGKYVKHSAQTATLKITPEPPTPTSGKGCAVRWEQVGENYEFTDKYATVVQGKNVQSQKHVEYQNKTPDSCSGVYLGDTLAAKVAILGMKDVVSCSTNFTIVKVDAKIGDVSEDLEEKQGIAIAHSYSDFQEKKLRGEKKKVLTVTVEPKLPPNETFMVSPVGVALRPEGTAYDANGAKIRRPKSFDKAMTFATGGSSTFTFGVWGLWGGGNANNCNVSVEHVNWSDRSSSAKDRVSLTCYSFKLITPAGDPDKDPNDGPDGKDGQNEFTYQDKDSNYDNKGVLRVYMKAVLEPAVKGTFKGAFGVSSIEGATLVWKKVGDESGCLVSPKGEVTADENGVFEAVALFVGYPKENGSFGRKTASFTLDGVTKEADYEVFFPKYGTNHPTCEGCPNCPNWFYYWRQGACAMEKYVFYGGSKKNMYGEAFVGKLSIYKKAEALLGKDEADAIVAPGQLVALYDLAAEKEQEFDIPAPDWAKKPAQKREYVGLMVGGRRGGLACCAAFVAHEQHHVDMDRGFAGLADADGDQVADTREGSYDRISTRTDMSDSYDIAGEINPMYVKYGDNEVRARKIEREKASYDKSQDWSNPGFQCKDHFGSYDLVKKESVK